MQPVDVHRRVNTSSLIRLSVLPPDLSLSACVLALSLSPAFILQG